jgi:hypothetical protein
MWATIAKLRMKRGSVMGEPEMIFEMESVLGD